jgi:hypothetical protein
MSTRHGRRTLTFGAATVGLLLASSPVAALDLSLRDPAVRLGVSLNPDQVHGGLQAHMGRVRPIRFRPSLDLGIGNGVLLASINADVLFRGRRGLGPLFVGGGPGLNFIDVTSGVGEGRGVEAKVVFNGVAGLSFGAQGRQARTGRWRYFVEIRAGFGDTPDAKLTGGVSF